MVCSILANFSLEDLAKEELFIDNNNCDAILMLVIDLFIFSLVVSELLFGCGAYLKAWEFPLFEFEEYARYLIVSFFVKLVPVFVLLEKLVGFV